MPFRKNLTGTGVYAYNVIHEISRIDDRNDYFLFTNKENNNVFHISSDKFQSIKFPFYAQRTIIRIFWEQFILPFYLKKYEIDVLFSPSVVLPIFSTCKNVICIHDLIPFHFYKKYSRLRSFYIKQMTKISANKADKIFTVSENSKHEIQKFCKISSKRIIITYNGISQAILNPDEDKWEAFKKEKNIPINYILYLGTLEPGKNIVALLRAFKILNDDHNLSHKLVVAGGKGWLFKSIFNEVKKLNLEDRVIFTDYVPNDVIGLLYKNADVFVLPSFYEGFGIPALEAMYFGTPVIVSNTSSLPEVVGQVGKLVDPNSEENIAVVIHEVLGNPDLCKAMIDAGYKQAAKFSWHRTAGIILDEILKLYEYGC